MHAPFYEAARHAGLSVLFFVLLACTGLNPVHAQDFGQVEDTETNVRTFYYFYEPGQLTVQVYAMGDFMSPGVYLIAEGTNLARLTALTGGPVSSPQPDTRQTTTLRLYRGQASQNMIFESSFESTMDNPEVSPVLQNGDVVVMEVERKRRVNWRDIFTVISPILSTLLLVERLTSSN